MNCFDFDRSLVYAQHCAVIVKSHDFLFLLSCDLAKQQKVTLQLFCLWGHSGVCAAFVNRDIVTI